ncbi:hypothetical protein Pflav_064190 [Phytohabitans flavus]|uniref:adenosine deaminase n=1 Tax=Phytohabitans flavus TaxID=1076124 RepID=A0A6F8Y1V0_9ACTN|nr:hypothetical protein Pflav_064190 [Phytohabitans flavus]
MVAIAYEDIVKAPKALLHDHLDGGLRPATIIELAAEVGHPLPATDPATLASWFVSACDSGSLERYIATFEHTVAVMQTEAALQRVAAECAIDLADDGVVYAEVRFAPSSTSPAGSRWSRWWRRCWPASPMARRRRRLPAGRSGLARC